MQGRNSCCDWIGAAAITTTIQTTLFIVIFYSLENGRVPRPSTIIRFFIRENKKQITAQCCRHRHGSTLPHPYTCLIIDEAGRRRTKKGSGPPCVSADEKCWLLSSETGLRTRRDMIVVEVVQHQQGGCHSCWEAGIYFGGKYRGTPPEWIVLAPLWTRMRK
jgi:hypothetical protein